MHTVHSLHLQNFMVHRDFKIDFPPRGIVLVTGANGSGKSSIIEAVSVALWGNTLRGPSPWVGDTPGVVRAHIDDLMITRSIDSRGKKLLDWVAEDEKRVRYATTTKAQQALSRRITGRNTWRWGSVLSSRDADSFTSATDTQRRLMIEEMLDLKNPEKGLKQAFKDYRSVCSQVGSCTTKLENLDLKIEALEKRIEGIQSMTPAQPSAALKSLEELQSERASAAERVDATSQEMRSVGDRIAVSQAKVARAKEIQKITSRAYCHACSQPISPEFARERQTGADQIIEDANEEIGVWHERRATVAARVRDDRSALAALDVQIGVSREESAQAHRELTQRQRASAMIAESEAKITKFRADVADTKLRVESLHQEMAILSAVQKVLEPKGFRSHLLAENLDGVADITNAWLTRIAGGEIRVELKPYSEQGIKTAISLDIEGVGGGYGYKGSSAGERRRIDLALLLSIGDLARSAAGRDTGTLFFDEVFDTLDQDGMRAAMGILHELADTRTVVVISHNEDFVRSLSPAMHVSL